MRGQKYDTSIRLRLISTPAVGSESPEVSTLSMAFPPDWKDEEVFDGMCEVLGWPKEVACLREHPSPGLIYVSVTQKVLETISEESRSRGTFVTHGEEDPRGIFILEQSELSEEKKKPTENVERW